MVSGGLIITATKRRSVYRIIVRIGPHNYKTTYKDRKVGSYRMKIPSRKWDY